MLSCIGFLDSECKDSTRCGTPEGDYWGLLITWDYLGLLETSGDYWRLLEIWGILETTGDYWELLDATGDYWILLDSTRDYGTISGDY